MPPATTTRPKRPAEDGAAEVSSQEVIRAICSTPLALGDLVKIEGDDGLVHIDLWPRQVEALELSLQHRYLSVGKARQLGMTQTFMLLALWECFAYPVGWDLVVSIGEREASYALGLAAAMYDSLPVFVQQAFPVHRRNATEFALSHGGTHSGIVSLPSSGEAGRGRRFRRVIADERARWENEGERMAALRPTIADGGFMVESSTAKGYNGHYATWTGAVDPDVVADEADPDGVAAALGNGYVRMFVGALDRPGRSLEWVLRERAGLEGDLGLQEYPLSAKEMWLSSGGCVFDDDALDELEEHSVRPPVMRGSLVCDELAAERGWEPLDVAFTAAARGIWRVWQEPVEGRDYVIAADPCGGRGGRDKAAAVVLDVDSWDEVACLWGTPDPTELAVELVKAGWLYRSVKPDLSRRSNEGRLVEWTSRPALLVPEANNHGAGVIAVLRERRYPRVYESESFDQRTQRISRTLGWLTTAKSRPVAIAALQEAVRDGDAGVRFAEAIAEMRRFEDPGNGRPEAAEGAHDDLVMTWAIGIAVLARTDRAKPVVQSPQPEYQPSVSSRTGY